MRAFITIVTLFVAANTFAQSKEETAILKLSEDKFRWEVEGKIDSLANLFDEKLVVVTSGGTTRTKTDYLADLKSGKTVHNSIDLQEASAEIIGSTGIVTGKGVFELKVNDAKVTLHLSYMEVYLKQHNYWKMVALHASRLAN